MDLMSCRHRGWISFLLILACGLPWLCGGELVANDQLKASPTVQTYTSDQMGSHSRFFSVTVGDDGIIYAASGDTCELYAFDGANWFTIPLPSSCNSLQTGKAGRVWLCLVEQIGYLQRNSLGEIEYREFETEFGHDEIVTFWAAFPTKTGLRFGNNRLILDIDETSQSISATATKAKEDECFVGWTTERIMAKNKEGTEFFVLDGEKRHPLKGDFKNQKVDCVIPLNQNSNVYVANRWTSVKKWHNDQWESFSDELDALNKEKSLWWVLPMTQQRLGVGGCSGFYCLDDQGQLVYQVASLGIQELNAVYSWDEFPDGRVGVACESGIAVISEVEGRNEWPIFNGSRGIYDLIDRDGKIYVSAESGLYEFDIDSLDELSSKFPIPIHKSPTHDILANEDEFLIASVSGTMQKNGDKFDVLNDRPVLSLARLDPDRLITLNSDRYFTIFEQRNGKYEKLKTHSMRFPQGGLKVQDKVVWLSTPESSIRPYHFPEGFENPPKGVEVKSSPEFDWAWIRGFVDDEFLVVSDRGILVSETKTEDTKEGVKLVIDLNESQKYGALTRVVRNNGIYGLVKCGADRLALFGECCVTVHSLVNGAYREEPIATWEILPTCCGATWDEERSLLWQLEEGKLISIDIDKVSSGPPVYEPVIRISTNDSDPDIRTQLNNQANIKVQYGLPLGFHRSENVQYRYRLQGSSEDWSEWSGTSQAEFQNLPGGAYRLEVAAKTGAGAVVSSSASFQVDFPWYLQAWSLGSGMALLFLSVYFASAWRSKQLTMANRRMEALVAERTREIDLKKKEIQRNAHLLHERERRSESERLKSLDTLVSGIAHDFNNLLMVISANNEMVKASGGSDLGRFADNTSVAVQSAADLCRELTDYSGSVPMELVSTSLNQVLLDSKELIANSIPGDVNVVYDLKSEDSHPSSVLADGRILKRALVNLVVNAAECCQNQITIRTSCRNLTGDELSDARYVGNLPQDGEYSCLEVIDDGPGISPEHLPRLFDPFYSTKKFGRGLGLAIVMRVVGRHNGVIFVESKQGHGATFQLCFPSIRCQCFEDKQPQDVRASDSFRLLLVDDDPLVLHSTREMLQSSGHSVTAYGNAKQGLEMIFDSEEGGTNIDCVILDVSMPEMSGHEMAEVILAHVSEMPIVFVSGHNDSRIDLEMMRRPNVIFLTKPYTSSQVNSAIRSAVIQGTTGGLAQQEPVS